MKGIEFADETWNPVWGCRNNCSYCYARPIAKRFGEQIAYKDATCFSGLDIIRAERIKNFEPTLIKSQLKKQFKKKTTHVFVNSMSDIMYWSKTWWLLALEHINKYPEKKFIFFTKDRGLWRAETRRIALTSPENCYVVFTANNWHEINDISFTVMKHNPKKFGICLEPLQESTMDYPNIMNPSFWSHWYNWVIIGAETGNRKGKIEVLPKWIKPFYHLKTAVFMKESIRNIVPVENFRQERI